MSHLIYSDDFEQRFDSYVLNVLSSIIPSKLTDFHQTRYYWTLGSRKFVKKVPLDVGLSEICFGSKSCAMRWSHLGEVKLHEDGAVVHLLKHGGGIWSITKGRYREDGVVARLLSCCALCPDVIDWHNCDTVIVVRCSLHVLYSCKLFVRTHSFSTQRLSRQTTGLTITDRNKRQGADPTVAYIYNQM